MTQDLKNLRKRTPLTVTAVASLMGVSQPTVSVLESGRHTPRVDTLARYYTAIGRDDLARPLYDRLTQAQYARVVEISQRLDAFAATLPPYFRDRIRPGG